jgi:hypothetical protein
MSRRFWLPILALVLSVSFQSFSLAQDSDEPKDETPGVNSGLVSALKFRGIGPALMSGRALGMWPPVVVVFGRQPTPV